jgi:hypothetical protein
MFSYDEGTTWTTPVQSSPTDRVGIFYGEAMYKDTIAVLTDNDAIAFNHLGFARTTNLGQSWSWTRDSFPLTTAPDASVALSPGTLHFASYVDPTYNFSSEVWYRRSTNLGTTWFSTVELSSDDVFSSSMPALGSYTDESGNTTLGLAWRDRKYGGCSLLGAGVPFRVSNDNGQEWSDEIPLHENAPCGYRAKVAVYKDIIAVIWANAPYPNRVRVSMDRGESWSSVCELTSGGNLPQIPCVALSPTAVHVAWEEATPQGWQIFYRRGQLPVTSVREEHNTPQEILLLQNYPNPFNPKTTIQFSIPLIPPLQRGTGGLVSLKVYNIYGQEVTTLVNKQMEAGEHQVEWNAEGFPSGLYFYKLSVTDTKGKIFSQTKKMIVMK